MTVSVVIPCYNAASYIEACLDSIVGQTYADTEIICVNDGSGDNTEQAIQDYQLKSSCNLRLVNQANGGGGSARNSGFRQAKGEYIQFLDADDQLFPDKLRHQTDLIKAAGKKPDFIAADFILESKQQKSVIRSHEQRPFHALLGKNLGITSANLWRRKVLENVNGFDERLKSSQEYDLMFRILQRGGSVLFDPVPLTLKCERNASSISKMNKGDNRVRFIHLQLRVLDYLRKSDLLDEGLESYFYHKLFYEIRLLHEFDPVRSFHMHRELIPSSFRLEGSAEISARYITIYKLFGYRMTQKIWNAYNSIHAQDNQE
ncbi:MAG: glycosyltransferase family A protein [Balneolales bacterium]